MSEPEDDSDAASGSSAWFVYVLVSDGGDRTYVGITTDLQRRLAQHNGELPGGARSTRAGRPWTVGRTLGPYEERGFALKMELQLKRRARKRRLDVSEDELVAAIG